jgi:colanic acid/amylovoran biosynthesis glycosyltransferase
MKRVAYLLHNFPGLTDTFIKREIRSLQRSGTQVNVISVWKPQQSQTTPEILSDWASETDFLLPRSYWSVLTTMFMSLIRTPNRFCGTLYLAFLTSRPGVHGLLFQFFYFCEAVLAADILRTRRVEHLHNHIGDQSGTVTMLAAKLVGIEYSITFHGWPVFFDARYSQIKEKVVRARFTRAISYFCRSQLMMFSGLDDPTPFKIIHCGLTPSKYDYRPPRQKVATLFCAARVSPEKGISFLVRALKSLISQGYDFRLRIAGNGPSLPSLKQLVSDLGMKDSVAFLGYQTEEQIIRELQASDLFVLPSFVEGVPVSAMEAMAIGVPVIATNIAGTSELVEDGKTGLLVRPSDTAALIEAILKLANDHDFRLRLAEVGRKKVETEFDVDKESAKLNSHFSAE